MIETPRVTEPQLIAFLTRIGQPVCQPCVDALRTLGRPVLDQAPHTGAGCCLCGDTIDRSPCSRCGAIALYHQPAHPLREASAACEDFELDPPCQHAGGEGCSRIAHWIVGLEIDEIWADSYESCDGHLIEFSRNVLERHPQAGGRLQLQRLPVP